MKNKFLATFEYKLIYIFRINDENHNGYLKIGDATIHTISSLCDLKNNCEELNKAAKKRINQYTVTAGIVYELLHTEIAVTNKNKSFRDYDVHNVLKRSGIKKHFFETEDNQNEWFEVDLLTAIKAIKAVKEGRGSLNQTDISYGINPIVFRPEQKDAIKMTVERFKHGSRMLWNAKMRFGKTLSALQVAKEMKFKKTIIITHRPVVSQGWFDDFNLIFYDDPSYAFSSKTKGENLNTLIENNKSVVYFASMQDLRGSEKVGGNFSKNTDIFDIDWDFVVIDEAHEGTKTEHGINTLNAIIKKESNYDTKVLQLSGTPFNLLNDYNPDEIYTWDYVMEQEAKEKWYLNNFLDSNPYEDLPRLNIFTYNLNKLIVGYEDIQDKAFNFKEFFRVWTGDIDLDGEDIPFNSKKGDFVHEGDVISFLNLISKEDSFSNYPYSTLEYRNYFRHSLWMVPGVKEAHALSRLLKRHEVFSHFKIVNVAGDGDEEENYNDALVAVKEAIGERAEDTYTITISCGRLTTGVSVPAWTAVFMLYGSYFTAASNYLQTIFRVQTPAKIGGKVKEECYVFDFAPDRTLRMVAEAGQLSTKVGSVEPRQSMSKFLNYCPVIAVKGSNMIPYNTDSMLQQLKKAYASKVVQNGFDDTKIYNNNLWTLEDIDLEKFSKLQGIIGSLKQTKKVNEIDINKQGFSNEEYEIIKEIEKKPKKSLTEEEKAYLEEKRKRREQVATAISILRGISIRIPLLIFGAEIDSFKDINCDNFVELIDDSSWEEFMPRGVTKEMFKEFSKYYDQDIFVEAGRQIRNAALYADTLSPDERVKNIALIFATFKNPDKETVLTPWKTVNMHLKDTLGGYSFYSDFTINNCEKFIDLGEVTLNTLGNSTSKILEINSKTGLYPLYVAYSIYKKRCMDYDKSKLTNDIKNELWEKTLEENIFVLCKTDMAKSITKRTLAGYKKIKLNIINIPTIVEDLKEDNEKLVKLINNPSTWNLEGDKMKFDAIVGNPPYQKVDGSGASTDSAIPIYNLFVELGEKINTRYLSMIIPAKWMVGGRGLQKFRDHMIKDTHLYYLYDYEDAKECFSNVHLDGGVCYFLWDRNYNGEVRHYFKDSKGEVISTKHFLNSNCSEYVVRDNRNESLFKKVSSDSRFSDIVSFTQPFGIRKDLFNHPERYNNFKVSEEEFDDSYKIYGVKGIKGGARRVVAYIEKKAIKKGLDAVSKYKLFFTTSYSTNAKIPPDVIFASPGDICTETFLMIGPFNTKRECINCFKYMNTKFFRTLLYFGKGTMQVNKSVFNLIPLVDFKNTYNDKKLYEKYNLSDSEIKIIEDTMNV